MPKMEIRTQLPDDSQALELSIVGEDVGETSSYIDVPDECGALVITVTAAGDYGFQNGPKEAEFKVETPFDEDLTKVFKEGSNGQRIYIFHMPKPGRWPMLITHRENSNIEVNASALKSGWGRRIIRGFAWLECKACKYALKTIIIALLIKISPIIAAAAGGVALIDDLVDAAGDLLDLLMDIIGRPEGDAKKLLAFLSTIAKNPINDTLEQICKWLGLCAA